MTKTTSIGGTDIPVCPPCRIEPLESRTLLAASPYPGPNPPTLPGTLQAENFDQGGEGVAYHDLTAANTGGQYRPAERVDIEKCSDTGGGFDVGWNQPGEWLDYTFNVGTAGSYSLDLRVAYGAPTATGGTAHMEVDGYNYSYSGAITLPKTGGWQTWQTVSLPSATWTAGQHVLRLVFDKDGSGATTGYLANVNWIRLLATSPSPSSDGIPAMQTIAPLSAARWGLAATTVGTKAFFAGGQTNSGLYSTVDIYDASTGLWSTANLAEARIGVAATTVGTKALFAGGFGAGFSSTVDIYDADTGLWSTAALSEPRNDLAATTVGAKAFFAGGSGSAGPSGTVDIYDASTGQWSTAALSEARWGLAATAVGSKAIFAGGFGSAGPSGTVDIYDTSTGTWTTAALSEARYNLAATTVGTKAIFAGGLTDAGLSSTVDIYDASTGLWTTSAAGPESYNRLAATTVGTKALFADGAVAIYDAVTGQWSWAALSETRYNLAATTVGTKAIFAGGYDWYNQPNGQSSTVDVLDFAAYPGPDPTPAPGTIQAENFDNGGQDVGYHDLTPANAGGQYRPSQRVDIEKCSEGGYDVGWNQPGEWLDYTVNVATSGPFDLDLRAAYGGANVNGGTVHLECDGVNVSGPIALPKTAGWQTWQTVTTKGIDLSPGQHVLKLVMDKDGAGSTASTAYLANLNWIKLTPSTSGAYPGPNPTALPGTIQAENFDKGVDGVAYHDLTPANTGGQYRTADGVDIEKCSDTGGGFDVGWNQPGEWLGYTVNVASAGSYNFDLRVAYGAATATGGTAHLEVDGIDRTGPITLPKTGGWQTWQTVSVPNISLTSGQHFLRLVFDKDGSGGTSGYLANVNWLRLLATSPSPYPGPNPAAVPGTIQLENFDSGGEGVGYHDTDAANQGGKYRATGVDIEACADTGGGYDVGWNLPGEWLQYMVNVASTGVYDFAIRAAYGGTMPSGGTFRLYCDNVTDLANGALTLPNTGGWQKWQTVTSTSFELTPGKHTLRLVFENDGSGGTTGYLANVNWMQLTAKAGTLDPTFGAAGVATIDMGSASDAAYAAAVQPSGKIVVLGTSNRPDTKLDFALTRLTSNGALDTSFGTDGKTFSDSGLDDCHEVRDDIGQFLVLQPDGKILAAGNASGAWGEFDFARYDANGVPDATYYGYGFFTTYFTANSSNFDGLNGIAPLPDGRLIAVGYTDNDNQEWAVGRVKADGDWDWGAFGALFGMHGMEYMDLGTANAVALQSDGKIVVGSTDLGFPYGSATDSQFALVRLNADGSLDTSFGGTGIVTTNITAQWDEVTAVAIQPDGRIVVAGRSSDRDAPGWPPVYHTYLARYTAAGALDPTFGTGGIVATGIEGANPGQIALQADGRILMLDGSIWRYSPLTPNSAVYRFNPDGSRDLSFGSMGRVGLTFAASGLTLQDDGKLLVAGDKGGDFAVARLLA